MTLEAERKKRETEYNPVESVQMQWEIAREAFDSFCSRFQTDKGLLDYMNNFLGGETFSDYQKKLQKHVMNNKIDYAAKDLLTVVTNYITIAQLSDAVKNTIPDSIRSHMSYYNTQAFNGLYKQSLIEADIVVSSLSGAATVSPAFSRLENLLRTR